MGDHREIFWVRWHLPQGLESELMGLARDMLSHGTCADFMAAHHTYAGPSHPYPPIRNPYPYISACSGDQREIFWEMCYLLQGLESEGMGLPRDVSSGATYVGFTAAHHCTLPIPTILCHTPTMHRGVKAHVHRGRWGAWLASPSWGNVPPSPLPCSCLHRGQLVGSVSVHTDHPYFVWQTHKKYGAQQ